jgi:4-amino-4-deoxy-L-arabinose transferase-like glycosyltransferase
MISFPDPNLFMFILSFSIAMIFSIFLASLIRGLTRLGFLLSLYLFFTAHIILCFEIAGLLRVLEQPSIFIILQLSLLIIVTARWFLQKKPPLFEPFLSMKFKSILRDSKDFIRKNPILVIFLGGIVIAYVINATLIILVPPNNTDGFYLHMTRVGYWLQNKSFLPFKTFYNIQVFYPLNAQAQIYWTVLFTRSDMLVGFIQYSAALFSSLAVFGIARLLGFRKTQSLFASLLWLSFPQVLFQSTSVQNDLVPSAYLAISLFLIIYWTKNTSRQYSIFLSALSLALALGTKQTVFFILPGFGFLLLMIGLKVKRLPEVLLKFGLSFMIYFFFLGAVIYIQNLVVYGNSLGQKGFVESESSDILVPGALNGIWLNLNRIGYQSLDTSGLPPLIEGYLFRGKAFIANKLYSAIDLPIESQQFSNSKSNVIFSFLSRYPVSEDFVWFGLLAPFLLVIACTIEGCQAIRSREPVPIGLILISIFFILCELAFRPGWDINIGRNFTLAVIPIVPFVSMFYKHTSKSRLFVTFIIAISLITTINLLLHNPAKPMVGDKAIWSLSRNEKLALQNGWLLPPLNMVEKKVPGTAVLGIFGSFFEYPFFGEHFQRTLVPLSKKQLQDNSFLESKAIDFILLRHPNSSNLPDKQTWGLIGKLSDWALYQRITP